MATTEETRPFIGKRKVSIPVIVTKNGAINTGSCWCVGQKGALQGPGELHTQTDYCYDSLDEEDWKSGTAVVRVTAELDFGEIFKSHDADGNVSSDLLAALRELVTLKDEVKDNDVEDYKSRKPAAWQAARDAIRKATS